MLVKGMGWFLVFHLSAVWPWIYCLISLGFSFFICKMEIITLSILKIIMKGNTKGNDSLELSTKQVINKYWWLVVFSSVQSLSRVWLLATPWITPGLPVHHQFPEFIQTHVHRVGDAIQPSHPLLSPSTPAANPSQYQGVFQWVNSSHQVAKVLEFQLQHQSFQWTPRTDLL